MQSIKEQLDLVRNIKLYGKEHTPYYWIQSKGNNIIEVYFSDNSVINYDGMLFNSHGLIIDENETATITLYSGETIGIDLSSGYLVIDSEEIDDIGTVNIKYVQYPEWFNYKYLDKDSFPRYNIKTETVVSPDGDIKYSSMITAMVNLLNYTELVFYITDYYDTPSESVIDAANMMNRFTNNKSMKFLGFINNPIIIDKTNAQMFFVSSLSKYGLNVHIAENDGSDQNIIPYSQLYGTDNFILFASDSCNYIIYDEEGINPIKYSIPNGEDSESANNTIAIFTQLRDILLDVTFQHIVNLFASDSTYSQFKEYIDSLPEESNTEIHTMVATAFDLITNIDDNIKSGPMIIKNGINITIIDDELIGIVKDIMNIF